MNAITDKSIARSRLWMILPWLVLALGIPSSFLMSAVVRDSVENLARLRFERLASDTRHVIQQRIDSYGEILYGLAAVFSSQDSVSRLQFHRYVESLDLKNRFPGFDVVNYAQYVRGEDKEQFEKSVRHDRSLNPRGYPNFRIRPPGDRSEYYVLVYVEPMEGFEFAFGLDTSVNPAIKDPEALTTSISLTRDSGKLNSPGLPIRIKRHDREYIGLGMRLGVYRSGMPHDTVEQRRAAFIGSVGAGFNVENLMRGVINTDSANYVNFRLYGAETAIDPTRPEAGSRRFMLYDSNPAMHASLEETLKVATNSAFTSKLPLEVGGREWEVHFDSPKAAIIDRLDSALPWIVLGGWLVSTALLFGMFYSLASSRSRAVEIANEMTRDLRASTEQLQAMSRQLVDIQESERRQFSRELHDRVGQNLTALSINLDIIKTQIAGNADEALKTRLEDAAALLESTAGAIENVMSELRPPMLDDYGLLPALQWYSNEFTRRTGIHVHAEGEEDMKRLPQASEIALFRIAQEALNNVVKHAHASSVDITLSHSEDRFVMSITDDGVGLDAMPGSLARRRHGLGMMTMRERTQAVQGQFEIGAAPVRGTRVTVTVPG